MSHLIESKNAESNKSATSSTFTDENEKVEEASSKERVRCLSPHVCTRYYRPPEIIVLEADYSTSVDIWSFGAILGELLQSTEPYYQAISKADKVAKYR